MKRNDIVPIIDMQRRPPVAGRIRLGKQTATKNGKMRPTSIDTFRFTSSQRTLIAQCAEQFGGTVKEWDGDQWEVESTSSEIPVLIAEGGLDQTYELWSGGGCQRRCDGEICTVNQAVSEYDYEKVEVPCMCMAENLRSCQPKTRLLVILPTLAFAGMWRLDTSGWNAMQELPAMSDLVLQLAERGQMVRAVLGVEKRDVVVPTTKGAQTRNFVVPFLKLEKNVHELMAGAASITAISAAGTGSSLPALPRGDVDPTVTAPEPEIATQSEDDDIADGVIVDDELLEIEKMLRADAINYGLDGDRYVNAVSKEVGGDKDRMRECSRQVRAELLQPMGFSTKGVQWGRPK